MHVASGPGRHLATLQGLVCRQAVCPLVCRHWAVSLTIPSAAWSTLIIQPPLKQTVYSWVNHRASVVQCIDISVKGYAWQLQLPAWCGEAKGAASSHQIHKLLNGAARFSTLSTLKFSVQDFDFYHGSNRAVLRSVWSQIVSLTKLQSLTLVDSKQSRHIQHRLSDLSALTALTSLQLHRGGVIPSEDNLSLQMSLCIDINTFAELMAQLHLQSLTLGFVCFNTSLDAFWKSLATLHLKTLKLEHVFAKWSGHRPVPALASRLVNLR